MRIGEITSNMMMVARNQNHYVNQYQKSQTQLSTGKRVNTAADDPSAIGRIQRTKALLNESIITSDALEGVSYRNQAMETSLDGMGSMAEELGSLAIEYNGVNPHKATIESQATSLLDAMVDMQDGTLVNGSNPFTDGKNTVRLSGGKTTTVESPKFQITKNATDPTHYDIILNDGTTLSDQSVSDILDSDYIQENLTNQISGAKAFIGINERILESRKNIERKNQEILTKTLSNLEDADLTKSTVEANIASQMITLNQGLMSTSAGQMQSQVGMLFNMLA